MEQLHYRHHQQPALGRYAPTARQPVKNTRERVKAGTYPGTHPGAHRSTLGAVASATSKFSLAVTVIMVLLFSTDTNRIDVLAVLGVGLYAGLFGLIVGGYLLILFVVAMIKIGVTLGVWGGLLLIIGLFTGNDLAWTIVHAMGGSLMWGWETLQTW